MALVPAALHKLMSGVLALVLVVMALSTMTLPSVMCTTVDVNPGDDIFLALSADLLNVHPGSYTNQSTAQLTGYGNVTLKCAPSPLRKLLSASILSPRTAVVS